MSTAAAVSTGLPASFDELAAALRAHPPRTLAALGCSSAGARQAVETLEALSEEPLAARSYDEDDLDEAVAAWAAGELDLLWKLELPTAAVMRSVLAAARDSWFSHLGLVLGEGGGPSFILADAGLNRSPGLEDLVAICERAVAAARKLGAGTPQIGLIAHREHADPAVPGSQLLWDLRARHGAEIEAMGATLLGPTGLDIALDPAAAARKGVPGGRSCDVLLVPDIIVGNVLYKAFMLARDWLVAGAVYDGGERAAAVPSRAASLRERVAAAAFATALGPAADGEPTPTRRYSG